MGNSYYSVFIDAFTSTTYLLMVTSALPKTLVEKDDGAAAAAEEEGIAGDALSKAPSAQLSLVQQPSDEATLLNIALARPSFEKLIAEI